uniref:Phosphoribosyltransferase domain-containing protein n=1 Tax=Corethron hystrix TaxID=216773 RepID=A0A6U5GKV2_9STRA|mmetsp:Transcript_26532/g.61099  ORF Transcript_26532/g.61099 Transcript_26532/m.61099 type:complete len:195 (+) Transcript_26532:60-644(+)
MRPSNEAIEKKPASDGKIYYSYADVHTALMSLSSRIQTFEPHVILAIGGGGFIPARILRTALRRPILATSLELYDDATESPRPSGVRCLQWFDPKSYPGSLVPGGNVLVVDEVDDTRTTLEACVGRVLKDGAARVAVAVVHNKRKMKTGRLPDDVEYFCGEEIPDVWTCYPWDAETYGRDIVEHEKLAKMCGEH